MKKYAFGADIGGPTVKIGLFKTSGELLDVWEIPTRTIENGIYILSDIAKQIEKKIIEKGIDKTEIEGIGMGVPGPVDENGQVLGCVNLGWDVFNVEEEMTKLTGLKAKAGNDANIAALGEMWKGGGSGYKNLIMVTLGTGVGGGVIMGGRPLIGANGAGGEIGHICVNYFEEKCCGCGKKGCLEQYASATGIARIAREHLAADKKDSILRTYDLDKIDAKIVFDALKEGDQLAVDVVEEFGEYLAKGLADVAVVVDPSLFVIGGGVSKAGEILLTYIEKYYRKRAFFANKDTQFAIASLGNDAGICGAAKLILDSQV